LYANSFQQSDDMQLRLVGFQHVYSLNLNPSEVAVVFHPKHSGLEPAERHAFPIDDCADFPAGKKASTPVRPLSVNGNFSPAATLCLATCSCTKCLSHIGRWD
jgi:hypothetical protein